MKKYIPMSAYMKLKRMDYVKFNNFIGHCIETVIKQREEQRDDESLNEIEVRQALSEDFTPEQVERIVELLNIKLYENEKYNYICEHCGGDLTKYPESKYCPHCGRPLEWV